MDVEEEYFEVEFEFGLLGIRFGFDWFDLEKLTEGISLTRAILHLRGEE